MVKEAVCFPRRLSGLLSGCPPTGTRPQARAKLGERANSCCAPSMQEIFSKAAIYSAKGCCGDNVDRSIELQSRSTGDEYKRRASRFCLARVTKKPPARRGGRSLDAGRRQRVARLAQLLRVGSTADHQGSCALHRCTQARGRKHEKMSLAEEKALLARFAKAAGAGEMSNIRDQRQQV
jgi:hypothetical protein